MKVVVANPPNIEQIVAAFPDATKPGVVFAYGDTIFNPSGVLIPRPLIMHEEVHGQRQANATPKIWWDLYITDERFRYEEELHAHVAEYRAQLPVARDRNQRAMLLMTTARRLIAPLYNYPKDLDYSIRSAMNDITYQLERL